MNKLIALTFIALMLSSNLAFAIDQIDEDQIYGKGEIGEDIVVNVDEYQPKTIPTSLLEEQDVRVYALLKGIPSNPSISIDRIRNIDVKVKSVKTEPEGKDIDIANVRYIKPGRRNTGLDQVYDYLNGRRTEFLDSLGTNRQGELGYTTQGGLGYSQQLDYDNLGFVEVTLKKIKKEADVPEQVNVELEGTIDFDVSSGAGAGPRTDVLTQQSDAAWQAEKELHRFYGGYIRVERIGNGRTAAEDIKDLRQPYQGLYLDQYRSDMYADIALYDLHGMPINPIPTLTKDPVEGDTDLGIRERFITLRAGQTSPAYKSPTVDQTGTQLFNRFKIRLDAIRAQRPSVETLVQVGDSTPFVSQVGVGDKIHPDSQWTLKSIQQQTGADGRKVYVLTFRSIFSKEQTLTVTETGQPLRDATSKPQTPTPSGTTPTTCTTYTPVNSADITALTDSATDLEKLRTAKNSAITVRSSPECQTEALKDLDLILLQYKKIISKQSSDLLKGPDQSLVVEANELQNIIISSQTTPTTTFDPSATLNSANDPRSSAIAQYYAFIEQYKQLDPDARKNLETQYADAHYKLALTYMSLGDDQRAIALFNTYLDLPTDIVSQNKANVQNIIIYLQNNIQYTHNKITLPEKGRPPTFLSVFPKSSSLASDSSADIIIGQGTNTKQSRIHVGDQIFRSDTVPRGVDPTHYNYIVQGIETNYVTIVNPTDPDKTTYTLSMNRAINTQQGTPMRIPATYAGAKKTEDDQFVTLAGPPDTKLEAVVTIIPVQEQAFSTVNFNLHLPIEKRLVELPLFSSTIDKEINKTQKLINDVDKLVNNVGKLHEIWSKLCLTTFGVLWAKNLLSPNKGFARKEINDHWKTQWQKDKQTGESPPSESFDSYLIRKQDKYQADLDSTEAIFDRIDQGAYRTDAEKLGLSKQTIDANEGSLKSYYIAKEKIKDDSSYLNEYVTRRIELKNLQTQEEVETLQRSDKPADNAALKKKVEDALGLPTIDNNEWGTNQQEYLQTYLTYQDQINLRTTLGASNDLNAPLAASQFDAGAQNILDETGLDATTKATLKAQTVDTLQNLAGGIDRATTPNAAISKTELADPQKTGKLSYLDKRSGLTYPVYVYAPRGVASAPPQDPTDAALIAAPYTLLTPALLSQLTDKQIPVYYKPETNAKPIRTSLTLRANTASHTPIITQYPKGDRQEGKTRYVSIDAYHYIEYEYGTGGRITNRWVWQRSVANAAPGSGSDIRLGDYLTVYNNFNAKGSQQPDKDAAASMKNVDACISKFNRSFEKSILPANPGGALAGSVQCGKTNYRVGKNAPAAAGPSCTDFMDPGDCHILFNACDPVICPASRCNLGGQWQVDNVVATGLVGSVSLCAMNFPEVDMPVCITGIRAGLQNIKSILEGYNQCLITNKNEGQSVGICDRVRNIYVCEILWKEGVAIFNVKGGLLSFVSEKLFGAAEGGDEYSDFSSHFDNSVKGLQYFTQDYAKNVFAGYDGGSLDEIGTNICKNAIYGKAPGVGNFFDDIQKPESPPQFMAFFDQKDYTDIKTTPESLYSVYYHIYAGENEDVRYTVFLRSTDAAGQIVSNVKYLANNQPLTKGQNADENKDFVGVAGYNEICVIISTTRYGRIQQCGFGKVSTDFSLNYLNEKYISSQASQQIKNERECTSDSTSLSSLSYQGGSSFSGGVNPVRAGVGSVSTGLMDTGIVRKCSTLDLNKGYDAGGQEPWAVVGTCGQDDQGRDLGQCWLYRPSVYASLKQQSSEQNFDANLRNLTRDLDSQGLPNIPDILDNKATDDKFKEADATLDKYKQDCHTTDITPAREAYQQIIDFGATPLQQALAHFQLAESYLAEFPCWGSVITEEDSGASGGNAGTAPTSTPAVLTGAQTISLAANSPLVFTLPPSTQQHTITVTSPTATSATVTVASVPQTVTLNIDETGQFNIENDDTNPDLSIKLDSVNGQVANLIVEALTATKSIQIISRPAVPSKSSTSASQPAADYSTGLAICNKNYQTTIVSEAGIYNIDPLLVTALILGESNCDKNAQSDKNAFGLMQLTVPAIEDVTDPSKGAAYQSCGKNLNLVEPVDYVQPEINIKIGTCYFAYLFKEAVPSNSAGDERIRQAVQAYNAGPDVIGNTNIPQESSELATRVIDIYHKLQRGEIVPSSAYVNPAQPSNAESTQPSTSSNKKVLDLNEPPWGPTSNPLERIANIARAQEDGTEPRYTFEELDALYPFAIKNLRKDGEPRLFFVDGSQEFILTHDGTSLIVTSPDGTRRRTTIPKSSGVVTLLFANSNAQIPPRTLDVSVTRNDDGTINLNLITSLVQALREGFAIEVKDSNDNFLDLGDDTPRDSMVNVYLTMQNTVGDCENTIGAASILITGERRGIELFDSDFNYPPYYEKLTFEHTNGGYCYGTLSLSIDKSLGTLTSNAHTGSKTDIVGLTFTPYFHQYGQYKPLLSFKPIEINLAD